MALLNRAWLHFIFLGAVFFQVQAVLLPEPRAVIGPLSEARIKALETRWFADTGRYPSQAQKAGLIALELDGDMLVQRALASGIHLSDRLVYQRLIRDMKFLELGDGRSDEQLFELALQMHLHLDDEVVRQRLIHVMEQRLLAENPPLSPTDGQVRAEFENRSDELRQPSRFSFEHVFFGAGRESEAKAAIARINVENLDFRTATSLGSPFMEGHKFTRKRPAELAGVFGGEFVHNLAIATAQETPIAGHWFGPVRSTFGLHYLWVNAFEPASDARLEDVEKQLRRELEYTARAQALQDAIFALRTQFDVRGHETWITESDAASTRVNR